MLPPFWNDSPSSRSKRRWCSLSLTGVYGVSSPYASGTDVKQSQVELNYDYTGIKGVQIIPSIYYTATDNGSTTNSTTGFLRIERDF